RRRIGAVVADELVRDPVQLVGGDTGGNVAAHLLDGGCGQLAGLPHPLDHVRALHVAAAVRLGRLPVDVLGTPDRRRDRASRRDGGGVHWAHPAMVRTRGQPNAKTTGSATTTKAAQPPYTGR